MNLFLNPSLNEFRKLISECDNSSPVHNLVVDYDGEVLIDPDLKQPEIDLDKFKLRIQLRAFGNDYINRSSLWIKNLFKNLVDSWEGNLKLPASLA